ncbi:peptidoglycan DD-metalloendopeptidase family protein [Nocardioides sp. Bht2]|uniref:peptidoglycan DD-metalloendopeptidase family protein n=1 Tax=Nocardioides sp. Bht2 TaxID=3392297 RepID=UPI0039B39EF9
MTNKLTTAVGGVLALILAGFIMLGALISGEDQLGTSDCVVDAGMGSATLQTGSVKTVKGLTAEQTRNAAAIIAAGVELKVPAKGQAIAVMTAYGESTLRILNYGDSAGPDSRGLFQQRDNGAWGTYEDRMDPRRSSLSFYRALLRVKGWQGMSPTLAAHTVQRNADPYHYEKYWDRAVAILEALSSDPALAIALANGASTQCDQAALIAGGSVVYPIPPSMKGSDRKNWGNSGGSWSSKHTGTDFSVPCGTPVFASTGGKIIIDRSQAWAGPWLVKVSTGAGKLTTWYAHMQAVNVRDGQTVSAGERIGDVGTEGNSTGCHLHFEVHPKGGSIYEDNINPSTWLAQNVGKTITLAGQTQTIGPVQGAFVVGTFNALGHSHTARGGYRCCSWPTSPERTQRMVKVMQRQNAQVVALQEFQGPQQQEFRRLVGRQWGMFFDLDNAIVWRKDMFDLVSGTRYTIPYFGGQTRKMPLVVLRHRATGRTFVMSSIHNPANAKGPAERWRIEAMRRERAIIASFNQKLGIPFIIAGDFNEYQQAFCTMTAGGLLSSASGGSNVGGKCNVPARHTVNWIFGSKVRWSGYVRDDSTRSRPRTSDHPYLTALAFL